MAAMNLAPLLGSLKRTKTRRCDITVDDSSSDDRPIIPQKDEPTRSSPSSSAFSAEVKVGPRRRPLVVMLCRSRMTRMTTFSEGLFSITACFFPPLPLTSAPTIITKDHSAIATPTMKQQQGPQQPQHHAAATAAAPSITAATVDEEEYERATSFLRTFHSRTLDTIGYTELDVIVEAPALVEEEEGEGEEELSSQRSLSESSGFESSRRNGHSLCLHSLVDTLDSSVSYTADEAASAAAAASAHTPLEPQHDQPGECALRHDEFTASSSSAASTAQAHRGITIQTTNPNNPNPLDHQYDNHHDSSSSYGHFLDDPVPPLRRRHLILPPPSSVRGAVLHRRARSTSTTRRTTTIRRRYTVRTVPSDDDALRPVEGCCRLMYK